MTHALTAVRAAYGSKWPWRCRIFTPRWLMLPLRFTNTEIEA